MKKGVEILGIKEETLKSMMRKSYTIMVEDTDHTRNINIHCFDCLALSYHEAIGKMYFERPEFLRREILSISETEISENAETINVYLSEGMKKVLEMGDKILKECNLKAK